MNPYVDYKFIGYNARTVVLLGFLVWILLVKFGSKNTINSVIFILAFSAIFISLFGYLAVSIKDYFFRSSQMEKLAKKYSLNYTKPKESFTVMPKTIYKKNILEGKVSGKSILIYDFVRWYWLFSWFFYGPITRSATIISVVGIEKELRGFFTGLCSVKKIDSFLSELSKKNRKFLC